VALRNPYPTSFKHMDKLVNDFHKDVKLKEVLTAKNRIKDNLKIINNNAITANQIKNQ
jgi:hypothetical protein